MMDTAPPHSLPARYHPAWRQTIRDLTSAGTLGRATPAAVQALAVAVSQWQEATDLIEQTGTIYDDHGTPRTSPAIAVQTQAAATIARLSRQLGLHRQDSSAAPVPPKGEEEPMGRPPGERGRWCGEHSRWECARNKHGGVPCHGIRVRGQEQCAAHLGHGNREKRLASKAIAARPAERRWEPIAVHPAEALLREVAWWAGQCAWLDSMVEAAREGDLTWGMTRRQTSTGGEWPGTVTVEESAMSALVAWQQRSHGQLAQVSRWALEAAAEDRMVRLAEAQGAHAFAAFQSGLRRLGLSAEQWSVAREVMPEVLKELTAA